MKTQLPNGSQLPHLLQLLKWVSDPIEYMKTCDQKYGDIFVAKITTNDEPFIFVSHPQDVQKILTDSAFDAPGYINEILVPLTGEKAIFMLDGDRHKRERKLLMPPFHGERMREYGELICGITQKMMNQIKVGEVFIAREIMQEISLGVILQAVFGVVEGDRYEELKPLVKDISEIGKSPLRSAFLFFKSLQQDWGSWSPWGRFLRQRQQLDHLLYKEIQERRENPDETRTDILHLMMVARDEDGNPMSDLELRDELLTLLFAGHETTATAMAWGLYWIYQQPEVYEKLMAELNALPSNSDPTTISRLPYLTAVCQETLRIHPVAMLTFPRKTNKMVELMGYQIPPDTLVTGCIYLTHQREDLYPEPKKFKPERFLERKFSTYEFIPFGAGSRQCIGMALAQYEMKLALATILLNYELKLAETQLVKPARRGVTLSPLGGVKMLLQSKGNQTQKSAAMVGSV